MRGGVSAGIGDLPRVRFVRTAQRLRDGCIGRNGCRPGRNLAASGRSHQVRNGRNIGRTVTLGTGRDPVGTQRSRVPVRGRVTGGVGDFPRVRLVGGSSFLGDAGVAGNGSAPTGLSSEIGRTESRATVSTRSAAQAAETGRSGVTARLLLTAIGTGTGTSREVVEAPETPGQQRRHQQGTAAFLQRMGRLERRSSAGTGTARNCESGPGHLGHGDVAVTTGGFQSARVVPTLLLLVLLFSLLSLLTELTVGLRVSESVCIQSNYTE